ncbi:MULTISPECIES: NAD-dependent epimerase/dehydratase family protein [unclassified Achromobacter]|uniref:NAD-dependent epimerase/dehydratase family protein n=1 Tax=unclassified Achromobacter TaxID=2626865 RepID=UPI000B51DD6D|nr:MULTISPECIES: NAD-dependent epimerase/dehydratase family protein [unclassified Achromobacter]OWT74952.1 epimerase [Achromobacter sp. HZ28]OWT76560.1 epimerase [Achromobacter sp. HZ34]
MKLAILGATSQIARDFIACCDTDETCELALYARRPDAVRRWLNEAELRPHAVGDFAAFGQVLDYDAVLNFVGVGNPAQAQALGASIFETTLQYDQLALDYVRLRPDCRYIFLSSGAVYGGGFTNPVVAGTQATAAINAPAAQDWYAWAKLATECRHRALAPLPIVDLRVFSYFSRSQDLQGRFLISDMLRAVRDGSEMQTSSDYIVRDFLVPEDFHQLVHAILTAAPANCSVDCYSQAPIDKSALLAVMQEEFGLRYTVTPAANTVNATGAKTHYYSTYRRAADFGYQPRWSSQTGIVSEASALLAHTRGQR